MKRMYMVVLVLFFVVLGCVLYFGISGRLEPVFNGPFDQPKEEGASGILDSAEIRL